MYFLRVKHVKREREWIEWYGFALFCSFRAIKRCVCVCVCLCLCTYLNICASRLTSFYHHLSIEQLRFRGFGIQLISTGSLMRS